MLMPRFVVLLHETPAGYVHPTHFDMMFEHGDVLLTWAVEQLPTIEQSVTAQRLPDHRPLYLDYEGPVSENRGTVKRIDRGDFDWVSQTPARYEARINGQKLRGTLVIEQDTSDSQRWRVVLSP